MSGTDALASVVAPSILCRIIVLIMYICVCLLSSLDKIRLCALPIRAKLLFCELVFIAGA